MTYDVIVIGAGAAGEGAGTLGGNLGAKVAVIERDLVGGECSFWACMPSKTLLNSAAQRACGADYPWERASARRDWMIAREDLDYPTDIHHVRRMREAGGEVVRGTARIVGPGKVEVRSNGGSPKTLESRNLIVATGSTPFIPPIEGIDQVGYWTSRDGTSLRELPSSIVILGGGPVGVELAQVYARFGVPVTIVQKEDRILVRDHPRSSAVVTEKLAEEGVQIRVNATAIGVKAGGKGRIVQLADGSTVEGAELLIAIGRRPSDLRAVGIEEAGVELTERGTAEPDERMAVGDGVYVAGDAAGGLQFTHVADYEGRVAARAALGQDVRADLGSVPKATYTDPETGQVGRTVEEARAAGIDAFEVTVDWATTSRGITQEGSRGHVTAVIDRERKLLVGAFAACPDASDIVHEAVLALKAEVPVPVIADAIHAFPSGSRVFGNLMLDAEDQLR